MFIVATGEPDMDAKNRVQDNRVDMGADEYSTVIGFHIFATPTDISIHPNPFTDKVVLSGDFANYQIKVFGAVGNLVADYSGVNSPLTINLNTLGNGMYFISVQHEIYGDVSVYKIIKQ